MKVLIIGQLPKEVGGKYTTGICNVVYEISKCHIPAIQQYVYATNIDDNKAQSIQGTSRYYGTRINWIRLMTNVIMSPISTAKQWWNYYRLQHMNPIRFEFYKENIERVIRNVNPDIIHCLNSIQLGSAFYAKQGRKIPILVTLHGIFESQKNDCGFIQALNEWADYTTGLTYETSTDINKIGLPLTKSFLVPNGVDTSKVYFSHTARQSLRDELKIDDSTTLMITVGSLQHRKGQLSFCKLLKQMPVDFRYKYLILGNGEDKNAVLQFIAENNMQNKVQVVGYVANTNLYKYLSAADVYIHGSYQEGQALSEIEAYATDLKIAVNRDILGTVVTDTSNSRDYFVFDYSNFDICRFIQWAREHKDNRQTRRQYDWKEIYNQYYNVYQRILNN